MNGGGIYLFAIYRAHAAFAYFMRWEVTNNQSRDRQSEPSQLLHACTFFFRRFFAPFSLTPQSPPNLKKGHFIFFLLAQSTAFNYNHPSILFQ